MTASFVIILQVRTSSSRLPGKALLPVAGMPAAVLAARRAARSGAELRVATSDAASDDQLATVLRAHGLAVYRGPLDNVLARFAAATADLDDDVVVVRLTADNVFPDADFLADLLRDFAGSGLDYLGSHSPLDGLPYGMSAELFTVGALRQAREHAVAADDIEHVTPWIRRHLRARTWRHPQPRPYWSRLRCTIDSFSDYQAVSACFHELADPVGAPWEELAARLAGGTLLGTVARCPFRIGADGRLHSALTLGGAQLGMAYGVANSTGKPDAAALDVILGLAVDAGITAVDTARAYQESEERIGGWVAARREDRLRVVTKLDTLAGIPADAPSAWVRAAVDASVFRSLTALRTARIDTLLMHRWEHHAMWQGAAWQRLLELRSAGLVGTLGSSVANVDDALAALQDPAVGHLQCPVNLIDQRWRESRWTEAVARRPDVVVHARSVLLQGLLTLPAERWPQIPGLDAVAICELLDGMARRFGRRDRVDLCMAYVRALPWVHSLVVGVDSAAQLRDNLDLVALAPLSPAQMAEAAAMLPALPLGLLDPARWHLGNK